MSEGKELRGRKADLILFFRELFLSPFLFSSSCLSGWADLDNVEETEGSKRAGRGCCETCRGAEEGESIQAHRDGVGRASPLEYVHNDVATAKACAQAFEARRADGRRNEASP